MHVCDFAKQKEKQKRPAFIVKFAAYIDNEHRRAFMVNNELSSFEASTNNNARYDRPVKP